MAETAWVMNHWIDRGDEAYDFGVYALDCRVGDQTGKLGFRSVSDTYIDGEEVNVVGYPFSKGGTTMWYGLGDIVEPTPFFLYYNNDTSYGQSGGPVWERIIDSCNACVVAIHSGPGDGEYNAGVRITSELFAFLIGMKRWEYGRYFLPLTMTSGDPTGDPIGDSLNPYPAPESIVENQRIEPVDPYPAP
jgi:glutamyl endopeptidase